MSTSPNSNAPSTATAAAAAQPRKVCSSSSEASPGYQSQSNAVSLISNPSPTVATYQWVPRGVKSLNRRNKLSSLPFWHPNDTMRTHQFRLVLLRGIVKEVREEDEPVAVFVEYVPPPSSSLGGGPQAKKSSATTASDVHPNGCRVAVRLVNIRGMDDGDRSEDVVQEDTCVFDDDDRQIAFRDFLSAKNMVHPSFSPDDGHSVVLEVTITVGVNVVAETVAKSTGQIAGSLWSTWSSLTTSVTTLYQKTVQVVQEQRSELESAIQTVAAVASGVGTGTSTSAQGQRTTSANANEQHQNSNSGGASSRSLPWDDVPEKWIGREELWRHIVTEKLVEDENTFLIGAKRGISSDEQMLLTQQGINHRAVMAADTLFDYERDVHEGLLSLPALRAQRYRLVPLKVKDEVFWANFMWKIASLSTCTTEEQAQLLLSIISAPGQHPSSHGQQAAEGDTAATASASHLVQSWIAKGWAAVGGSGILLPAKPLTLEEVSSAVKEAVEAASTLEELIAERETNECFVGPAVSSCEACMASLEKLQRREEYAEFADVVEPALGAVQKQLHSFKNLSTDDAAPKKSTAEDAEVAQSPQTHLQQPQDESAADDAPPQSAPREECKGDVTPMSGRGVVDDAASEHDEKPTAQQDAVVDAIDHEPAKTAATVVGGEVAASAHHDEEEVVVVPLATAEVGPSSTAKKVESSFERLPSIDDMETPLVDPDRRSTATGAAKSGANTTTESVTGGGAGQGGSGKKLEFEPMPWEDDEDA